jgi:hypothetical protein
MGFTTCYVSPPPSILRIPPRPLLPLTEKVAFQSSIGLPLRRLRSSLPMKGALVTVELARDVTGKSLLSMSLQRSSVAGET